MNNYYFPITTTEGGSADLTILSEFSNGGGVANPTGDDYYNDLTAQKTALAETLQEVGVEASTDETFSTLVPKNNEKLQDDLNLLNALTNDGVNINHLFRGDTWLQVAPKLHLPNATSARYAFAGCTALEDASNIELGQIIEAEYMFQNCSSLLSDKLPKCDFTNLNRVTYMFSGCAALEHLGDFIIPSPNSPALQRVFENCTNLKTVGKFIAPMGRGCARMFYQNISLVSVGEIDVSNSGLNVGTAALSEMFNGCASLEDITFTGSIGASISFSSSPLNLESAKSVITALKDYAGTTNESRCTVTFSSYTLELLEAEGATAPNGITWKDYAMIKGWNI